MSPNKQIITIEPEELIAQGLVRDIGHRDFGTKLSSYNVIHFTPKFETLLQIVDSGFRPSSPKEVQIYRQAFHELRSLQNFFGTDNNSETEENYIDKFPICCFCDIPLKLSKKHRENFGLYGIGLTKNWAISKGFNPVIYIAKDSNLHSVFYSLYRLYERFSQNMDIENADLINFSSQFIRLLKYVKPYLDSKGEKKYYDEREWRYIVPDSLEYNPENPDHFLKFNKDDFVCAIVKNARERKTLLEKLRTKFGYISSKRIKIKRI